MCVLGSYSMLMFKVLLYVVFEGALSYFTENMLFSLVGSFDRAAYCPREIVYITSYVQNQSTRDMRAMKAKIVQTVQYRSSKKTKPITSVIDKIKGTLTRKQAIAKLIRVKARAISTLLNIYDYCEIC